MRILISSDIHANILACEALAKIYAREKCDLHITLGDAVDLGPWPKETLEFIKREKNRLKPNHDGCSSKSACGAAFRDGPRPGPSSLPLDRRLRDLSRMLGAGIDPGFGSSFDLRAREWEGRARPHLAGLIVDRLRERRGVDASARPDKARRILGEELWGVVAGTAPAPRSTEELSTLIERIHEL